MIEIECSTFNDAVEVFTSGSYVCFYEFFLNVGVAHDEHNVCWVCELVDVRSKAFISDDHWLENVVGFDAAQFELLNDIWNLFEPMYIFVVNRIMVGYHKESAPFKNYGLICTYSLTELRKGLLELLDVWEENANNLGPCLVQSFVPNTCAENFCPLTKVRAAKFHNFLSSVHVYCISLIFL